MEERQSAGCQNTIFSMPEIWDKLGEGHCCHGLLVTFPRHLAAARSSAGLDEPWSDCRNPLIVLCNNNKTQLTLLYACDVLKYFLFTELFCS